MAGNAPSIAALRARGLPYAPYIQHGSWVTGQPDIAFYGRDPYRGIMGLGQDQVDQAATEVTEAAKDAVREAAKPVVMVGLGMGIGAAAGAVGGLLGSTLTGAVAGLVGGGALAWLAYRHTQQAAQAPAPGGMSGILAVL